jgi:hypothetical protein
MNDLHDDDLLISGLDVTIPKIADYYGETLLNSNLCEKQIRLTHSEIADVPYSYTSPTLLLTTPMISHLQTFQIL